MSRGAQKIALEEKGQRTARSTDVYRSKRGYQEVSLCKKCGLIYRQKRWELDEKALARLKGAAGVHQVVCPACQRMEDNQPGGVITLAGSYLREHEEEILDMLKNAEVNSRLKNPLGRIMEISQEKDVITIATTEDKLAQKLGRQLYKAHRGELHYHWSHEQRFVRVNWSR